VSIIHLRKRLALSAPAPPRPADPYPIRPFFPPYLAGKYNRNSVPAASPCGADPANPDASQNRQGLKLRESSSWQSQTAALDNGTTIFPSPPPTISRPRHRDVIIIARRGAWENLWIGFDEESPRRRPRRPSKVLNPCRVLLRIGAGGQLRIMIKMTLGPIIRLTV
jgi:hypothetical protein